MSDSPVESLFLELGDIIRINASSNDDLDQHVFFIDFIDNEEMNLIDDTSLTTINLKLSDGIFNDKSIESIEILDRSDVKGYARQNNLIPGKTITLRFGGDVPLIVNGTITDLEEDMIEIKTYPEEKVIYIDFGYHGIPKNIPLESIENFEIPIDDTDKEPEQEPEQEPEEPPEEEKKQLADDDIPDLTVSLSPVAEEDDFDMEFDVIVPITNVKDRLKRMIIDADDIIIGKDLGSITEEVPVEESAQRFGIETQTNDMLDEMLSTIPSSQRTTTVLNNIHLMIERFKQLRSEFSVISPEGEIMKPKIKGVDYKPLVNKLSSFNKNLHWLIPIAKNKKKLYNIDDDDINKDVISMTLKGTQDQYHEYMDQYKENRIPDGLNKYKYVYKELNKLYTPFGITSDTTDVITEEHVNNNFDMIIDNLGDFYSSVARGEEKNVVKQKFLMTRYNKGLDELHVDIKNKQKKYNPERIPLTRNDKAAITGIMTLEEPALLYSHVNLPNSSILLKSHLALVSFNFWSIFKKNREIVNVEVELDTKIRHEETQFLGAINAFLFKEDKPFADREPDAFKVFLNKVIPRTRALFKFIKKYINNITSYLKLIEYLEPFLIYPDDITFKQYEEILFFLNEQVASYKQKLIQSEINYNTYTSNVFQTEKHNNLLEILDIPSVTVGEKKQQIQESFDQYHINDMTTSEAIRKIMITDSGMLYYSIISNSDTELFQPVDIDELIKQEMERTPEEKKSKDCEKYVMAKHYIDIDELREDDGNVIYFDKKYDTTRYDILDEFKTEQETQIPNDFKIFLINHLMHNAGLSDKAAQIEAKSIIEGKREVNIGEYAYVLDDNHQPVYFYRTQDKIWAKNEELSGKKLNEIMFCNLKESCISIKKKCGPIEINKQEIQKNLYKEILSQFDKNFHSSIEKLKKIISKTYNYNLNNLPRLIYLKKLLNRKNQNKKLAIANTVGERDVISSPYDDLINIILSQQDFVKKQKDIIAFCNKYTRISVSENPTENIYWLYCIKTSKPIIPTFYKRLADAYFSGEYKMILEKVKSERGKLSDDGDKIVDKYSGFTIGQIDYDESEGYDEQGFKIVSKQVLEADIETLVSGLNFSSSNTGITKSTKTVINVINTLDANLGISTNSQYEFISNIVNTTLDKHLPSRENYNKALLAMKKMKKKVKRPSYEKAYATALMMSTLSVYIVVIQTMMPNIITKKTFPTCIRSFKGFPLDGDGDTSGLRYIICAAINIAKGTRISPWNTLPRVKKKTGVIETINKFVLQLKNFMDSQILTNVDIKKKIADKLQYLSTYVEKETIPVEFDVKNWKTFLPPLKPIKVANLQNITPSFKSDLNRMLSVGDSNQFEKISNLQSKMFYHSLRIQELIQRVIDKKNSLLFTLTNEPFIQNACCNDGSKQTLQYFIDVEPNITKLNETVGLQSKLLYNSINLIKSPFIFDPTNTRLVFPAISNDFSEVTIYKTFIKFCQFNSGIALTDDLLSVCGPNQSHFKTIDDIQERIKIMKHEGKNYSLSSFYQLLNILNYDNIVYVDFFPVIITGRLRVEHLLSNSVLQDKINDTPLKNIVELLKSLFDSYESTRDVNDKDIQNATEFLDRHLDLLMNVKIIPFLSKFEVEDKYIEFIRNIETFKTRGDNIYIDRVDETAFAESEFLKQSIFDILKVYPSIIKNNVDYKNITVPQHWNLAPSHKADVINFIGNEFMHLHEFYDDEPIITILSSIKEKSNELFEIINATPFYANIKEKPGDEKYNTLMNGKLLEKFMKFYFLYAINIYLESLEEDNVMIHASSKEEKEILSGDVAESIISGRSLEIKERLSKLIISYLKLLMNNKKIINFSDIEINEAVIKASEREKSKIVENLGMLTQEELQVEDVLKNQKLGKWGLGLSKAIYQYDKDQYEKERVEFEEEAQKILELNNLAGPDNTNIDSVLFDMLEEDVQEQRNTTETNAIMAQLAEDDDFGDLDGDEGY